MESEAEASDVKETSKENDNAHHILTEEDMRGKMIMPKSEEKATFLDAITFITFGIAISIVIFLIFGNEDHPKINFAIRGEFSGYDTAYSSVNTKEKYMDWVKEFVGYTYQTEYYKGRNRTRTRDPETNYANYFVSDIRIVQRRMKTDYSKIDFDNYHPPVWKSRGFQPLGPKDDAEETLPFGPNNEYVFTDDMTLSGYVTWIKIFSDDKDASLGKLDKLAEDQWANNQTRSITVDFVLYNAYVEVFSYVCINLLFTHAGTVESTIDIRHIDEYYYTGKGIFTFRIICEIIFFLILCILILQQPWKFKLTFDKVSSDFEDQIVIEKRYEKAVSKNLGDDQAIPEANIGEKCIRNVRLIFGVLLEHFTNMWNLLDIIIIALSSAAVIYWGIFVYHQGSYKVSADNLEDPYTNDRFLYAVDVFYKARAICAYNLIFIFIRILKSLGYFSPKLAILFGTLDRAKSEIFYFIIFILAIMFAFILFVYLYFGSRIEAYSTPERVITALFQFMNWWYKSFEDMRDADLLVAAVLFIIFMLLTVFTLLNMFVGFLHKGYSETNDNLIRTMAGRDEQGKKINYFIHMHWSIQILEFAYEILAMFTKKYSRKIEKLNEERDRYTHILKINKIEDETYDKEYNPMKSFGQEKSKIPLTSQYIETKSNMERDIRCGKIFYGTVIYLVFVALYVVLLQSQAVTNFGNKISAASRDKLVANTRLQLDDAPYGSYYTFDNIVDLQYMSDWLRKGLPKYVEECNLLYPDVTYTLGSEFKITLRKGIDLNGTTQFDKAYGRIRTENDINKKDLPLEMKTQIIGNSGRNYTYSESGGYLGNGGYIMYWPLNHDELANECNAFTDDGVVGPDTWLFAAEFISYEPSSNVHLYNAVTLSLLETGLFFRKMWSYPLHFITLSSATSIKILILEAIFVLFLCYYMICFIVEIVGKWRDYSAWITSEQVYFTNLEIYQRNQKCPEIIRQLKFVWSIYRIFDILFFAFAITSIVYWIKYMVITQGVLRPFPYDHTVFDYHNELRKAADTQMMYINFSALSLITCAIRLIEYLQYAGNMSILTSALGNAMEDILYFVIIFASLMMGFAGMSHIAFSEIDVNFSTLADAWISCFTMIMGEFDMNAVLISDRVSGTFFIFVFLILFSYILLNIFLAILEINFSNAKEDFGKMEDNIRKLQALMCCWLKLPDDDVNKEDLSKQNINLESTVAILDDLSIQLDVIYSSLKWWADGVASQIHSEIKQRNLLKNQVDDAINRTYINQMNDENSAEFIKAVHERKSFIHYLRVASQFFEYQNEAISCKVKAVETELKQRHQKYENDKRDYYRAEKIGQTVQEELDKRMTEINNLKAQLKQGMQIIEDKEENEDDDKNVKVSSAQDEPTKNDDKSEQK